MLLTNSESIFLSRFQFQLGFSALTAEFAWVARRNSVVPYYSPTTKYLFPTADIWSRPFSRWVNGNGLMTNVTTFILLWINVWVKEEIKASGRKPESFSLTCFTFLTVSTECQWAIGKSVFFLFVCLWCTSLLNWEEGDRWDSFCSFVYLTPPDIYNILFCRSDFKCWPVGPKSSWLDSITAFF